MQSSKSLFLALGLSLGLALSGAGVSAQAQQGGANFPEAQYVQLDKSVFDDCQLSQRRTAEQTLFDVHGLQAIFVKHREVPVPPQYQAVFDKLVFSNTALVGYQVRLRAYAGRGLNAHEADHGVVVVSDTAWTADQPLDEDEFAAMVAHELSHLVAQDSRTSMCEMLALSGSPQLTLRQAADAVGPELMDSSTPISRVLRRWSQARETTADVHGALMLPGAGFDPRGMPRLLARLVPGGTAFARGSHPDIAARVDNVNQAIEQAHATLKLSQR